MRVIGPIRLCMGGWICDTLYNLDDINFNLGHLNMDFFCNYFNVEDASNYKIGWNI